MTEQEAVEAATQYIHDQKLVVGELIEAWYLSVQLLEEMAKESPPPEDIIETYESVRKNFRNHWVVKFEIPHEPHTVVSPGTGSICVFDDGGDIQMW